MPAAPCSTLAAEAGRAYVGYRSPGGVTVRRPSGGSERVSSAALAEAVLGDRLGHEPAPTLVDAFRREWVEPRARGEFVWPVVAVDEWLAAQDAVAARPTAATRSRSALRRTLAAALTSPHHFRPADLHHPLSPRGGH